MDVRRAPLLVPAVAALLAIVAEQHGCALPRASLPSRACVRPRVSLRRPGALAVSTSPGIAAGAGDFGTARTSAGARRASARPAAIAATVTGDVRDGDADGSRARRSTSTASAPCARRCANVSPGERIVVRGRLEPFDEPRNPGEPSMREIERDDGFVGATRERASCSRARRPMPSTSARGPRVCAPPRRARIRDVIPEPSATILAGALWGERGTLPDDLHDAFQATGTVHVLVTAGLHLGIVAALVVFALSRLRNASRRRPARLRDRADRRLRLVLRRASALGARRRDDRRARCWRARAAHARRRGTRSRWRRSWSRRSGPPRSASASFALSFSCVAAIVLFAEPIAGALARLHAARPHPRGAGADLRDADRHLAAHGGDLLDARAVRGRSPTRSSCRSSRSSSSAASRRSQLPLFAPLETLLLLTRRARPSARSPRCPAPARRSRRRRSACDRRLRRRWRSRAAARACDEAHAPRPRAAVAGCARDRRIADRSSGCRTVWRSLASTSGKGDARGDPDAARPHRPDRHRRRTRARPGVTSSTPNGPARASCSATCGAPASTAIDSMLLTHPHGDHVGGCAPDHRRDAGAECCSIRARQYSGRAYRDCIACGRDASRPDRASHAAGMRWTRMTA